MEMASSKLTAPMSPAVMSRRGQLSPSGSHQLTYVMPLPHMSAHAAFNDMHVIVCPLCSTGCILCMDSHR